MTLDPSVQVHPNALCETERVGARTRVWAFAHVLPGAVVGADCNICDQTYVETGARLGDNVTLKNGVSVWHGVTLEDDVFVGPNAVFTNDLRPRASRKRAADDVEPTLVRRGATIGANATVVCGTTIGSQAFVAAGAVVHRSVAAHALVAGNPARRRAWVCTCATRLTDDLSCPECGSRFRLVDETVGLVPADS